MSFYEDLASALDENRIEQRIVDGAMYIPTPSGIDLKILVDNEVLPAASIYLLDYGDSTSELESSTLLEVAFSVAGATAAIRTFLETSQALSFIDDLVDDPLGRFPELAFASPETGVPIAYAPCGNQGLLVVEITTIGSMQQAAVSLLLAPESLLEMLSQQQTPSGATDDAVYAVFDELTAPGSHTYSAYVSLGSFEDFGRLSTVLPFMATQARHWEQQLAVSLARGDAAAIPEDMVAALLGLA
ncbi:hypothetical protein ACFPVT_00875 [Corynebacterium choanae]|uniref:Uncharacterized protein n=1 Tax=Corynebacterium choanae TaxID=1862358 RepID=A0A3G6J5F8_9CORY|nr:hypothetical protein [Corynebacterium choanae]AZA13277.1 hypothetical protein CCHOA_04340 [Corynebacterium choanae]